YSASACAISSLTPLDEFFAKRVPDVLEQFGVLRRLPHLHRVARPRKVHLEHVLDLAWPRREQDDAVSERERFAEIVGDEQDGLLLALPDPEQHFVHVDLGVGIERAERL